jgi:phosphohistidine phosphatase
VRLILIRHAIAEDREAFAESGAPDAERPLTPRGRRRMARNARGLRALVPTLELIATSPLRRARETAEIVAEAYGGVTVVEAAMLAPGGSRDACRRWLERHRTDGAIAAIGHEPHLGHTLSWLVTGDSTPIVTFKKGGACCVDLPDQLVAGTARMCWFLTPRVMRRLRR